MEQHQKMSKKLLKGKDIQTTDIGAAAKEMQDNLDNMMEDYDDDAPNEAPIFTSELANMISKEKNGGKKKVKKEKNAEMEDDEYMSDPDA
jgi:hypothetical protein